MPCTRLTRRRSRPRTSPGGHTTRLAPTAGESEMRQVTGSSCTPAPRGRAVVNGPASVTCLLAVACRWDWCCRPNYPFAASGSSGPAGFSGYPTAASVALHTGTTYAEVGAINFYEYECSFYHNGTRYYSMYYKGETRAPVLCRPVGDRRWQGQSSTLSTALPSCVRLQAKTSFSKTYSSRRALRRRSRPPRPAARGPPTRRATY